MQQLVSRSTLLLQSSFSLLHGNYARSVSRSLELGGLSSSAAQSATLLLMMPLNASAAALAPTAVVFVPAGQHSCSGGAHLRQGCCSNLKHSVSSFAARRRCDSARGRQWGAGCGRAGIEHPGRIQGKLGRLQRNICSCSCVHQASCAESSETQHNHWAARLKHSSAYYCAVNGCATH